MSKARNLVILLNGSATITKKNTPRWGFFNKAFSWAMFDERVIINQLYQHIKEEHMLALDGPGTDITNNGWTPFKAIKSATGTFHGSIGDNGLRANLKKIEEFLETQYQQAQANKEELVIYVAGWSRGAAITEAIPVLMQQKGIKARIVHIDRIDPVIGGLTDRAESILTGMLKTTPQPEADIYECTYFSHTGNLNLWDIIRERMPNFAQFNTLFFSTVMPIIENNEKVLINDREFKHLCQKWIAAANHEGIIGKARTEVEQWVADVVLADIVRHLLGLSIKVDEAWANEAINKGKIGLENLIKLDVTCEEGRKFLLRDGKLHARFFGRTVQPEDNIIDIKHIHDFSKPSPFYDHNHPLRKTSI